MNPWDLLLNLLGWIAVTIAALIVLTFLLALIVAPINAARARRRARETEHVILDTQRDRERPRP
ncbi:hypothetical protein H490_0103980 [Leucobacter sp. UCD-THU]|uniref:hypothetical protein n=1 Tax=Leucobacter sp. UCD-THU TaxID=1292023 RepID=UPI00036E8B8F|nr:hypothetical protein [Leucobacter sp. UCD-THU]EYT56037.1 hypothetical protein H490_0103980 [Leucobacter sp. UCD-THU]